MPARPLRRRSSRLRKQGVAAPDQAGSAKDPDAEASKDSTEEKTEATEGDEQDRASTRSEATIEADRTRILAGIMPTPTGEDKADMREDRLQGPMRALHKGTRRHYDELGRVCNSNLFSLSFIFLLSF